MIKFLKKNIIFFTVFFIVMLVSLVLLCLDITMYFEIAERNIQTKESHDKIEGIIKKEISPVGKNAENINLDRIAVKKKVNQIQRRFGSPYRRFLLKFVDECKLDEDTVINSFKTHFEEYRHKSGDKEEPLADILNRYPHTINDKIFFRFMDEYRSKLALILSRREAKKLAKKKKDNNYDETKVKVAQKDLTKINTAFRNFFENMINEPLFTVEDLVPSDPRIRRRTREDIFACALGLPRTKPQLFSQSYLGQMQRAFVSRQLLPGVRDLDTVRNFTYKDYVSQPPSVQAIPEIMLAMPVFEDVARRIRDVEGIIVNELRKTGPTPSPISDKYLRYTFKLKINCTLAKLRDFVNRLHEAYVDNRVYAVRWISVNGTSEEELEELKKILDSSNVQNQTMADNRSRRGRIPRFRNRFNAPAAADAGAIAPYLNTTDLKYASKIVGKQQEISAEIDFDYYIFIGERVYSYPAGQQ